MTTPRPLSFSLLALAGAALVVAGLVVTVLVTAQAPYWDDPLERGVVAQTAPAAGAGGPCPQVVLTVVLDEDRPGYPARVRHTDCSSSHVVGDLVALRRDAAHPDVAYLDPLPASTIALLAAAACLTVASVGAVALCLGERGGAPAIVLR
ncbi:MAG: hypothetical protein U0Q15_20355 [Kineosporiaceae bacterium]